jgi:hypothetical protein
MSGRKSSRFAVVVAMARSVLVRTYSIACGIGLMVI